MQPLLTIAIPTWNRTSFLALNLRQLGDQIRDLEPGLVEVIVSDNASTDNTSEIVEAEIARGLPVRYIRNAENLGSDRNIAQSFNLARGTYVLIMGDDDLFIDGGLGVLLDCLRNKVYGVAVLRPYGYDHDFRKEHPGGGGRDLVFRSAGDFLCAIGATMTLISACVFNKSILPGVDANQFCGGNLVQVHLVLRAALAARQNIFLARYLIACKRNNSGGYNLASVFVTSLGDILDRYAGDGLSDKAIAKIERKMIIGYYPQYVLRERYKHAESLKISQVHFEKRFGKRWVYRAIIKPIFIWPQPLAVAWGAAMLVIGRILNDDLRRGAKFALSKLKRTLV